MKEHHLLHVKCLCENRKQGNSYTVHLLPILGNKGKSVIWNLINSLTQSYTLTQMIKTKDERKKKDE